MLSFSRPESRVLDLPNMLVRKLESVDLPRSPFGKVPVGVLSRDCMVTELGMEKLPGLARCPLSRAWWQRRPACSTAAAGCHPEPPKIGVQFPGVQGGNPLRPLNRRLGARGTGATQALSLAVTNHVPRLCI